MATERLSMRKTREILCQGASTTADTDRGSVYRAEQLAYSLGRIGAHLVHSRPYYSQGRGVIERWWQLADAFQAEVEAQEERIRPVEGILQGEDGYGRVRASEVTHAKAQNTDGGRA